MKKFLAMACICILSACAGSVDITTKPVDVGPLNVPKAAPMVLNDVKWNVVNQDGIAALIKKNPNTGFFVLSPDAYKGLAGNMIEIKRYIQDLQAIVDYLNGYIVKMREAETNPEGK